MQRFLDRQVQNFVNVLAPIAHFEDLGFVTRAFALLADQLDVGEKLHFHGDGAVALASLAAPTRDIERKVSGAETSFSGLGQGGKEVADSVESFDVGDRILTRGSPDRGLVHQYHVVDQIVAFYFFPVGRRQGLAVSLPLGGGQGLKEHVMQQG